MSETTKITETSLRGIEAVNPRLLEQYDRIVALLRSRLGPDHAFLLAEPVRFAGAAGEGRDVAWFVRGTSDGEPLAGLGESAAEAVRSSLRQLTEDVRNLADGLEAEGGASRELGRFLKDALVIPDESRI